MFTLFAIPKPFQGKIAVIQRNAIGSWTRLEPRPEILLFGDEEGIAEAARDLKVTHVPEVFRNEFGTPILSHCFSKARDVAHYPLLCYANSDIFLMNDFVRAAERIASLMPRFLVAGQRWEIEMDEPLDFSNGWQRRISEKVRAEGKLSPRSFMDYFLFSSQLALDFPAFAVGRPFWDNWLIYYARAQKVPVVDVSDQVLVVHQNHSYTHVPAREGDRWQGPEGNQNLLLAGGWLHVFTLDDCTHRLVNRSLRPAVSWRRLRRFVLRFRAFHPRFNSLLRSLKRSV